MDHAMTRGAVVSTLLHAALLAALLVSLPRRPPDDLPPQPDVEFDVVSDQPRQVAKAAEPSPAPATAAAASNVSPPAPPSAPTPPLPLPDVTPAPALPTPPPRPAPPKPPLPMPPPPIPPPPMPTPPMPTPPRPQPPPTSPVPASQPSAAKTPAPDMRAVDNTLARFRLAQQQAQSRSGGSPTGDVTAKLTGEQRGAIGDKVRECWTKDAGALDLDRMSVMMTVTLDAAGIVRDAVVGEADRGKLADPRFRAFAERARRANLDSRCSDLSDELPKAQLGHVMKLTFRFRP